MVCLPRPYDLSLRKGSSKHRSGLEIVVDVLSIVTFRARKTRIMYQANLSYQLIEKYLGSLLERGLLRCEEDSCYLITSKGKEFVQMYNEHVERCRRIGEDVDEARKERLTLENMCLNNTCTSRRMNARNEVSV